MSDPLEELRKISADEQQESRGEGEAAARALAKKQEQKQRQESARAARAARAPGFFQTVRFFSVAGVGLVGLVFLAVSATDGDWFDWKIVGALTGGWGLTLGVLAADAASWKRRLPFQLPGFERIGGSYDSSRHRAPWLAYEISIQFAGAGERRGGEPARRTLEILATRVNRLMNGDSDASFTAE